MKKTITVLIMISLLFGLVGCTTNESVSKEVDDTTYIVYSEHFGFTASEMAYLFQYVYSQYSGYLALFGVDTSVSLKEQEYYEGVTWFDSLMEQAVYYAEDFLVFCEEAFERGITLSDADIESIENELAYIDSAAREAGYSSTDDYLRAVYGADVTVAAYKGFMEKSALANKMYQTFVDEYQFSEEDILAYYELDPLSFQYMDYLSYSVGFEDDYIWVERLMQAASIEEFVEIVQSIEPDLSADALMLTAMPYSLGDPFSEWVFGGAKVNSTFLVEDFDYGLYTVNILTASPYRRTNMSADVRHILLTEDTYETEDDTRDKAYAILEQWEAGEANASSFGELAQQYSEDSGSSSNGGLYQNVTEGEMVDAFDQWVFDTSRKIGDTGIVKTDYGYHVMYFEGKGLQGWQLEIQNVLFSKAYEATYMEMYDKHAITIETSLLAQIDG